MVDSRRFITADPTHTHTHKIILNLEYFDLKKRQNKSKILKKYALSNFLRLPKHSGLYTTLLKYYLFIFLLTCIYQSISLSNHFQHVPTLNKTPIRTYFLNLFLTRVQVFLCQTGDRVTNMRQSIS